MEKLLRCSICIICFFVFLSCGSREVRYRGEIVPGRWLKNIRVEYDTNGIKEHTFIQIYFPGRYIKGQEYRTLICLHGYDGNMNDWAGNSKIEKYADQFNFILVCPNMKTTLYETKYYPQTTNVWSRVPGGIWIVKALIPFLNDQFAIANDRNKTGILGYSTGGRGSILLASRYPDIFGAAAGLSGYYDKLGMTKYKLLTSVYGEFEEFEKRWKSDDNIMDLAENLKETSVFLAHGVRDWVISYDQSRLLAIRLKQLQKKNNGHYIFEYHEKKYKVHDWKFWNDIIPKMMFYLNKSLE